MADGRAGVLALALLAACCGGSEPEPPETVTVAAAASLAGAMRDLATAFETDRPGTRLEITSGGSGLLVQQILRGAPVDLFISASPVEIDRLRDAGEAVGSPARIASNRLIVITPPGRPALRDPSDLVRDSLSVLAVGNPRTAPLGRYTREALERLEVWQQLEPRLVFAENARQTLHYVARGEADAGIVYASDAGLAAVAVAFPLAEELHDPIVYHGVVLNDGAAGEFLAYLGSPSAREAFSRHGFSP